MPTTKKRVRTACCGSRLIIDKVDTFEHPDTKHRLYFCFSARLLENGYSTCNKEKKGRRLLKKDKDEYVRVVSFNKEL